MNALLPQLHERRTRARADLERVLAAPTKFGRDLSAGERRQFDELEKVIRDIDARIDEIAPSAAIDDQAAITARRYAPAGSARAYVTREPSPYERGGEQSFFRDCYRARRYGDVDAAERLRRNDEQVLDHKRATRAISGNVSGQGGEFVPPLWLEEEFIAFVRAGRITADRCTRMPLPSGTDQINIPKIMTGTATAPQVGQNTGIQQTDLTTASVASPVVTIAGGQTVALQLMEQSPINIDEVVLGDLAADYAKQLNTQVLSGPGTSGTLTGLLTLAGTQSVAWTQSTPALGGAGGLYAKLANAIQLVATKRFRPANAIIMHPVRWAWIESTADTNNRPLVVPVAGGPFNAVGTLELQAAEGFVGGSLGLPVFVDSLIPTNLGANTNQDEIIVAKMDDLHLWEGQIHAEAFQQTYAQNMSVFVRLYNYCGFIAARYPQSICTITGTGAVAPTF